MYMFNVAEKEIALSEALAISEVFKMHLHESETQMSLFIKALANYIERNSIHNPSEVLQAVNNHLVHGNSQQALQRVLIHMVTVGMEAETLNTKVYSTGDVARFFGVSIATIHNWIALGRFDGIEKGERYKQVRFPENAIYTAPTGMKSVLSEVAKRYEDEQTRIGRNKEMTAAEEMAEIFKAVVHFEKKYGGTFEATLGKKTDLTPEQSRDAIQWSSLLQSVERKWD
ncbi:helix-turn-helix domain-containing protein [Paenibacillus sp. FSL K6-1096]|uniref:helix-turn-helix domain-containing protein n=1 Tax=Paenibacillus sp. FSL K6-1096 TaxID=2921460 RepID=UPI0030EC440D